MRKEEKEGETADASQNGTNGDAPEQQKLESRGIWMEGGVEEVWGEYIPPPAHTSAGPFPPAPCGGD